MCHLSCQRSSQPVTGMVFSATSSECNFMPLFFFEERLRVNSDDYSHFVDTAVKPSIERIVGDR